MAEYPVQKLELTPAAHLRVATVTTGVRRHAVKITLLDADGKQIGFASEEFRTGLPGEPPGGGAASGLDYLLHANPIARIAAMRTGRSNPYPVHRFVDESLVINSTRVPGVSAVSLVIDVEHSVPATPARRDGEPYDTLMAPHACASVGCDAVFVRRTPEARILREKIRFTR